MNKELIIGIVAFIAAYLIIKFFLFRNIRKVSDYETEILDILNNDKYKVKRRFE